MGARLLSFTLSLAYVGSVYILPGARERSYTFSVLWRRIFGVSVLTAVAAYNYSNDFDYISINASSIYQTLKAVIILHLLYFFPLLSHPPKFDEYKYKPNADVYERWQTRLTFLKNLVVGPLTEEIVYRGVISQIYQFHNMKRSSFLRENTLYFGLAHIHHAIMRYLDGEASLKMCAIQGTLHFLMTALFGLYSSLWLVRSNSLWPSIALHVLCNTYGVPRITNVACGLGVVLFFVASYYYL